MPNLEEEWTCELCDLEDTEQGFLITRCKERHIPKLISRKHNPRFSDSDKRKIMIMFPDNLITYYEDKKHAYCYLEKRYKTKSD